MRGLFFGWELMNISKTILIYYDLFNRFGVLINY